MPFNITQRKTLAEVIRYCTEEILENPRSSEFLLKTVESSLPSEQKAIEYLRSQKNLMQKALTTIDIPPSITSIWKGILHQLDDPKAITFGVSTKELSELRKFPNYDPFKMAEIVRFEEILTGNGIPEKDIEQLIRLRELYLEMTPLQEYQYGESYTQFRFRIGKIPLNLHQLGEAPLAGEISEEVESRIQERWELHERYFKEKKALQSKLDKIKLKLNSQSFASVSTEEGWEDLSDEDEDAISFVKKSKSEEPEAKSWKKMDQQFWQYYCLNDLKEAARIATLMLGKYPYVVESWWNNYMININNSPSDNIIFRKKVLEMSKKDSKLNFFIQINALIDEDRFKEAIETCDNALRLYPNDSYSLHLKAYCFSKMGKELEAIEALECKPLRPFVILCNIGLSYMIQLKQHDNAEIYFRKAIEISPPLYWLPYLKLAQLKREKDQPEEAIQILNEGLKRTQREEFYQELSAIYLKLFRLDNAIEVLQLAQAVNPYDDFHWRFASAVLLDHYKPKAALELLNNAIDIFKSYPAVLPQHVGDLYMLRGVALCKMNRFSHAADDIVLAGKFGQKLEVEITKIVKFLARTAKFVESPPTHLAPIMGLFPPVDGTIKSFPTFWQEAKGFQYFPLSEDERHQLTEYYLLYLDANPTDSISEAESLMHYLLHTDNEGISLASQNSVFLYFLCLYWKKDGWTTEFAKVGEIWKGSKDSVDQEFWESLALICNQAPVQKFMQ